MSATWWGKPLADCSIRDLEWAREYYETVAKLMLESELSVREMIPNHRMHPYFVERIKAGFDAVGAELKRKWEVALQAPE